MTDDEVIISHSLREFSKILGQVEDEMEVAVIEDAETKFITPLEKLRKDQIESVRKAKKDFDKQTQKFCGAQDRYVTLKKEESLAESAESVRLENLIRIYAKLVKISAKRCLGPILVSWFFGLTIVRLSSAVQFFS